MSEKRILKLIVALGAIFIVSLAVSLGANWRITCLE